MTNASDATNATTAALISEVANAEESRRNVSSAEVEKHLELVHRVVARFMKKLPGNIDRGDLVAAGMYGLVTSLERNGGDEGDTFEGYAKMRIRGAILDELRAQDWLSRRARWAANEQAEGYGGPTALVGFDDVGDAERAACLADTESTDALGLLVARGHRAELEGAVSQLPEREAQVIAMHYFEGVEFKAIAAKLGVSAPRVSQLHARALGRLRGIMNEAVAA